MATQPQHSETMAGEAASSETQARSDIAADAAIVLAALSRMQAAVRDDRAALRQLRASLLDMARAIAGAKHVADSEAAAAMLDEFEHRVDAMIEIAGGRAAEARQETAEPDQVPTVSGVVSQLGPNDATADPAPAEAAQPAESAGGQSPAAASPTVASPTVAMLTAMVEALSASIQTPAQQVEAAETPAPPPPEPANEATAADPPPPGDPKIETALLASFVQMEARPFPPPDEGTAVIFTRPESAPEPEPAPALAMVPDPAALPESAEAPPPAEAEAPPVRATAVPPEAEFDPSDFLFGPEPEPDPAAFLLDPLPPQRKAVLPQAEFVTTPPAQPPVQEAPAAKADPPTPPESAPEPALEPAPDDPLRALKAMTENERLAIFS